MPINPTSPSGVLDMTKDTPKADPTPTSANLRGKAFLDFPFQNGIQSGIKVAPLKRPRRFRPKDRFGMVIHFLGWADDLFQKTGYEPHPDTLDVAMRLAFKGYAKATRIRGAEKASVWRMIEVQRGLLKADLRSAPAVEVVQ